MKVSSHRIVLASLILGSALAISTLPAPAATVNWTAGANGNWNTSTNWTVDAGPTQRVPTGTDAAQISNTTNYTATIDSAVPSFASLFIGNTANNATGTVTVATGGSATITSGTGAINLSNNAGSSGTLKIEGGALTLSGGGTASINIGRSSGTGYLYVSSGSLSATNVTLNVANSNGGTGYVYHSGGTVSVGSVQIDPSTSSNSALYEISGGTLTTNTLANGAAASSDNGTFSVVGSKATITVAGSAAGAYTQRAGSTLKVQLDNGGVSKINLSHASSSAALAGTLNSSFKGGAALTTSTSFRLIEAEAITGDFTTKPNSALWTTSIQTNIDGGSRDAYVLSLAGSASTGSMAASGGQLSFATITTGYATITGVSLVTPLTLNLAASAGTGTINGLIAYFNTNGLSATASTLEGYNIALTFTGTNATSYFAWDLSTYNATAGLSGISTVPEPSTVALLAACVLGFLVIKRFSRARRTLAPIPPAR